MRQENQIAGFVYPDTCKCSLGFNDVFNIEWNKIRFFTATDFSMMVFRHGIFITAHYTLGVTLLLNIMGYCTV